MERMPHGLGVILASYNGYNSTVNPQIMNEFSTAAFRMGHTLINSTILRMDNNGKETKEGNISLRDAFFNPYVIKFLTSSITLLQRYGHTGSARI